MRRQIGPWCAAVLMVCVIGMTGACTPSGVAVGDTQQSVAADEPAHDNIQGAQIVVGLVGSSQDIATDRTLLTSLDGTAIDGVYLAPTGDGVAATRASRIGAVDDLVARRVHVIAISGFSADDAANREWTAALERVRQAGLAVVFINAQALPSNEMLYAAALTTTHNREAASFASIVETIARDEPHSRTIQVHI